MGAENEITGEQRDVQIDLIKDDIICRAKLDEGLYLEYSILMEQGVEFPRIKVVDAGDGGYWVEDGRHRLQAHSLNNRKTIPCVVYPNMARGDVLLAAFRDNYGIGKKMSFDDARHTIVQLIEMKKDRKSIIEGLPYPKAQSERLYLDALRTIINKKCARASEAMNREKKLTTEDAARLFGLKVDQLIGWRKRLESRGKKFSANHVKASITIKFKSVISFTAQTLKVVMDRLQEGEVSKEYARGVLEEFLDKSRRLQTNLVNWENRFSKIEPNQPAPQFFSEEKTAAGYVMCPSRKR